jgi:hypothetical protein
MDLICCWAGDVPQLRGAERRARHWHSHGAKNDALFSTFPYVCPEPVLAK